MATIVRERDIPQSIRAFTSHGFLLDHLGEKQVTGTCIHCGRKDKMYVNVENQLWDCKVCDEEGNLGQFLNACAKRDRKALTGPRLMELSKNRKLLPTTLKRWKIGWNGTHYTLPVIRSLDTPDALADLKRYRIARGGKSTGGFMTTATTKHALFGIERLGRTGPIYLCEGEWDMMCVDEILRRGNFPGSVLCGTGGADTFKEDWVKTFVERDVIVCYDMDDAGITGQHRLFDLLDGIAKTLKFINWPNGTKQGFDVRDLFIRCGRSPKRAHEAIHRRLTDKPIDKSRLVKKKDLKERKRVQAVQYTGTGAPWDEVIEGYREWLSLSSTDPILITLATVLANQLEGDPLWMFLVAPPGGMKSELLMSLTKAPSIFTLTTLTPRSLISGARGEGGEDPSLLPKLNGRVLIIKDFTTILSMNPVNREEIVGILRDAYDGTCEKSFGVGMLKRYKTHFGIIAGVTPRIHAVSGDSAQLGERFLKCNVPTDVMNRIDAGAQQIMRALGNSSNENRMREALQKIGETACNRKVTKDELPEVDRRTQMKIVSLAQLVAVLRAGVARERYSKSVQFIPSPEVGTRLAKQFLKLLMGICLVKHQTTVGPSDLRAVAKVAHDTIPDRVRAIVKSIYMRQTLAKGDPATLGALSDDTGLPQDTLGQIMQDLTMLKVVGKRSRFNNPDKDSWEMTQSFKLTPPMLRLLRKTSLFGASEEID